VACRWTGRAGARSVRSIPPPVVPRGGCRQGADLTGLLNQLPLEVAPPAERPNSTTSTSSTRSSLLSRLGPWLSVPPTRPHPTKQTLRQKKAESTCRRPATISANSLPAHQRSTDAELSCLNWLVLVPCSTPTHSQGPDRPHVMFARRLRDAIGRQPLGRADLSVRMAAGHGRRPSQFNSLTGRARAGNSQRISARPTWALSTALPSCSEVHGLELCPSSVFVQ